MTTSRPPLKSIWENDDGDKIVVVEISEALTDEEISEDFAGEWITAADEIAREIELLRSFFLVTYEERDHRIGMQLDNEQWATLIEKERFRMTGIAPD
ncbi:hypothetical protein [Paraburkholderia bannensis]|uniref:hypothetical protein n=1 Tax=Paraburkholderia bannensis TaxID=765414 RepID=UPI002AB7E6AD|nr:hypothetical protein [Paraburkholderia bannensis]